MNGIKEVDILKGWNCYDWRNAQAILQHACKAEWEDIIEILSAFRIYHTHLTAKGFGNKSAVAKSIDIEFYKRGWLERKFLTAISVDGEERETPTHDIDCFRGKVALELEWNNKDPFYDRDLNNFRLLYDLHVADVGVLIVRSTQLQQWLQDNHKMLGKTSGTYGKSTTHYDKLEPRILGGGAGGCPIFVFAMTEQLYVDDR